MLEHKRSYSYCERTYYSNTQKQRTTASSFSSRHPEDGVEGGRKKNHANSLKWWRRRRQVWILNNWGRVRPSSPCPAAMRPFFWKSQHKIDVDEAIVVNSLNVTRNGASKKNTLKILPLRLLVIFKSEAFRFYGFPPKSINKYAPNAHIVKFLFQIRHFSPK